MGNCSQVRRENLSEYDKVLIFKRPFPRITEYKSFSIVLSALTLALHSMGFRAINKKRRFAR